MKKKLAYYSATVFAILQLLSAVKDRSSGRYRWFLCQRHSAPQFDAPENGGRPDRGPQFRSGNGDGRRHRASRYWNLSLAERVGTEIGRDARSKGVHFLLGPGVNIYRSPLNGRNFEYFGKILFYRRDLRSDISTEFRVRV